MMQPRSPRGAGLVLAALFALPAHGAEDESVAPVVVTATRTAQTADESLASVSVLEREDIEQSQAQSLQGLLARQAGISVANNGGPGKSTSVFMRGTNGDHALVLVDGVQLGSTTLGSTAFQHLPLEQIERIEIVRGPRSSLYGSEAVGGVIQIFTRDGQAGDTRVDTSAMTGSHDTTEITTAVSGGDDDTRMAFSAKKLDTEGINARTDGYPDRDGYTNDSASLNFTQEFGDATTLSLNALRAEGTTEFDQCGSFPFSQDCTTDFVQQSVTSELETQVASFWSTKITAGQTLDESESRTNGMPAGRFDTSRNSLSWQNDLTLGTRHLVTLGIDYRDDRVDSDTQYDKTERDNTAGFAQWQWTGERWDLQLNGRHDDNEAFGSHSTGGVAVGYAFADDLRAYASYGTGFKAPTFNDLYFPDSATFVSNPDLEPEESETVELGIEGGTDMRWSANLYRTEIDNIIVFDDPDGFLGPIPGTNQNLNAAEITGLELAANGTYGGWNLGASLTLLETEAETSGPNDDNQLPRRPDRKVDLDFQRSFDRVSIGGHVRHEGERYDDAANTVLLDDFTLVSLRLGYELAQSTRLEASVENVTDAQYQTVNNFRQPGRSAYVRLRYRM